MRDMRVLTFVSMDGVMQGTPEEDTSGGFRHGGWTVGYFDDFVGQEMNKEMGHPFDLLLGPRTYDIFASHWLKVTEPGANLGINKAFKYVATNRPLSTNWNGTAIALELAMHRPELVGKLMWAGGASFSPDGLYTSWQRQGFKTGASSRNSTEKKYAEIAPAPIKWSALVFKITDLDMHFGGWKSTELQAI